MKPQLTYWNHFRVLLQLLRECGESSQPPKDPGDDLRNLQRRLRYVDYVNIIDDFIVDFAKRVERMYGDKWREAFYPYGTKDEYAKIEDALRELETIFMLPNIVDPETQCGARWKFFHDTLEGLDPNEDDVPSPRDLELAFRKSWETEAKVCEEG